MTTSTEIVLAGRKSLCVAGVWLDMSWQPETLVSETPMTATSRTSTGTWRVLI
jgi:hypothetical protein